MSGSSDAPFLRVVDLETTGNSHTDGGVVEIGWQDVVLDAEAGWTLRGGPQAVLVDPANPISAATSAIHHIVDEDVAGAPRWQDVAGDILRAAPGRAPVALVAHRAAFEQRWCTRALTGGLPWICTWKGALRIWPEAPGHSNQGLRYWRRPAGLDRALGLPAHRAGPDAYVTAFHLRDMLAAASPELLIEWSAQPALLARVPYGRLRGRRFVDLGDEDLAGLAVGERPDGDLAFTVAQERARRDRLAGGPVPDPAAPEQRALSL